MPCAVGDAGDDCRLQQLRRDNVGSSSEETGSTTTLTTPFSAEPDLAVPSSTIAVISPEARTAQLADGTLELAAGMPDASWNSLPDWHGITVVNLVQYEVDFGRPREYQRDKIEKLAELGFNFVRVPLDTRLFLDWDDQRAPAATS